MLSVVEASPGVVRRLSPRQQKREDMLAHLDAAALRLIEAGHFQFTWNDLALEAGVSHSLIGHYHGGLDVLRRHLARVYPLRICAALQLTTLAPEAMTARDIISLATSLLVGNRPPAPKFEGRAAI